jgi:hypothetical protein
MGLALAQVFCGLYIIITATAWPVKEAVCNSPETGTLLQGDSSAPFDTIVFPQYASSMDGFYTGYKIAITSGTGRQELNKYST